MAVHLRAHHLLCLLTFVGRGYTAAFTSNMEQIAARLSSGADDIMVVEGPDDLCTPLMKTADQHCLSASACYRDEKAARDIADYLGSPISIGTVLPARTLRGLRSPFLDGSIRAACVGCPWADLCTAVADAKFAHAHLCFRHTANERQ